MLPFIVQHSETLASFVFALQLALYQPQIRHLLQIVDALIVCNQRKTLSDLSHLLHLAPDPKTVADFFRESPWTVDMISKPRKQFRLHILLSLAAKAGLPLQVRASLDDSLGKKGKATKHLEAVDYHHNHTESTRKRQSWCNGYVYVELHLQIGPFGFLFDTLYLREKKVRQLNDNVPKTSVCPIAVSTIWPARCCWNWMHFCPPAARCMCCSIPGMPLPS